MTTHDFLQSAWEWNPWVAAACAAAIILHGHHGRWHFRLKFLLLGCGLGLIFIALCSPIAVLARGYLFSAHMCQHLLLVMSPHRCSCWDCPIASPCAA
jgi:putative membrane protein